MNINLKQYLTPVNIVIALIGIGVLICLFAVFLHKPAQRFDYSKLNELTQVEQQLKDQQVRLSDMEQKQEKQNQDNRMRDSILSLDLSQTENRNLNILNQLNKATNEKINRIRNYNADSIRRAFADTAQ